MKLIKSNLSWFLLVLTCLSFGLTIAGCDSNPGGLSDEEKLSRSKKARDQQQMGQRNSMPTSRDAMPGANGASNGQ